MTKFKDTTKGEYKILWREVITEGERKGWSFGRVEEAWNEDPIYCIWGADGAEIEKCSVYDLVPAEPEKVGSLYANVFPTTLTIPCLPSEFKAEANHRLGMIRIDYYDNGTFTVTKEEVCI